MFVLTNENELLSLQPSDFSDEMIFQQLLEDHPSLLCGSLIDSEQPRRWLLVRREVPVPVDDGGAGWFSADHLFLDQDGIPTIVEVKRQSDTRGRREVVAQMLDYASNGEAFWSAQSLRSSFELRCKAQNRQPEEELQSCLGIEEPAENFWKTVQTNLSAGRLRLLFVGDSISSELRRIVEFLNRQMNPTEVLALQLRQYTDPTGLRMIAPTIYGQTEQARAAKSVGSRSIAWTPEQFFQVLPERTDAQCAAVARRLYDWAQTHAQVTMGRGKVDGSFTCFFLRNGEKSYPFTLYTNGHLHPNFCYNKRGAFADVAVQRQWVDRLNSAGFPFTYAQLEKDPYTGIAALKEPERVDKFIGALDWFASLYKQPT